MKSIKWLFIILLLAALMLTACDKDKSETVTDTTSSSVLVEETTQPEPSPDQSTSEDKANADTVTETESETETETETEEVKEVVDETLLNTQAMVDYLGNYLLRPDDMPHAYFIPDDGEQRRASIRLIQEMGEIEAKTYIKKTGRVDGWWLRLQRSNKADFVPYTFESSIELFDDAEGARRAMSPAYYYLYHDETRTYSRVDGGCDLGDTCEFFYSEKEDPATDLVTAQYNLAFTYKNAFVWVMARGLEIDLDTDYVLEAAGSVFEKLENAPTE